MRRSRTMILVFMFFLFPQAFLDAANFSDAHRATLDRFFAAIATSVQEENIQADSDGAASRSLQLAPSIHIASAAQSTVQEYFPMKNGDTKTYTSDLYSGVIYRYYETTKNGKTAWIEDDSADGSQTYFGYSNDSLVMYGADVPDLSLSFDSPLTILKNSQIINGGTIHSQTSLSIEGVRVNVSYAGTVKKIGSVTVPAGTFSDCIELSMTFSYTAVGESESIDLGDVWVLAPNVGKTKIMLADQFMNVLGWMELDSGTAGGKNIESLTSLTPIGNMISDQLWIAAVIRTEDKGPIEGVWQLGGQDTTARGDRVIWGYFYVSPSSVSWGSKNNPDLFVKIWMDVNGPVYVAYFHVSVPDIEVYTDFSYDGTPDQQGRATLTDRFVEHYEIDGVNGSNVQAEDGLSPAGYSVSENPLGTELINNLRIGAVINTEDKGAIDGIWRLGGQDDTARGDQVVWGYFYADPNVMSWGSQNNPDLFVKIWFDVGGAVYVDFFHVSVPDIDVYSGISSSGDYENNGTTVLLNRFVEHSY